MFEANITPLPELLKAVRAAMVLRGTSLHRWAAENDLKCQNLTKALTGSWSGPKATELVAKVRAKCFERGA